MGCSPWGHEESDMTEVTSLSLFTFMHWRRKWHHTPVFLPGESQGQGSLLGCHPWGCTEPDMMKRLSNSGSSYLIYKLNFIMDMYVLEKKSSNMYIVFSAVSGFHCGSWNVSSTHKGGLVYFTHT